MVVDSRTAQEILDGAEIGKRIAVIVPNMRVGDLLFTELLDGNDMHPDMFKINRARRELRTQTDGRITIVSINTRGGLRGMSLDRVYLEHDVNDPDLLANLLPSLNTRAGALIRY